MKNCKGILIRFTVLIFIMNNFQAGLISGIVGLFKKKKHCGYEGNVCGDDDVDYSNGCDCLNGGHQIKKVGFCGQQTVQSGFGGNAGFNQFQFQQQPAITFGGFGGGGFNAGGGFGSNTIVQKHNVGGGFTPGQIQHVYIGGGGQGGNDGCPCNHSFEPVCGSDGVTYGNKCRASCSKCQVIAPFPCGHIEKKKKIGIFNCGFKKKDKCCGDDGVTYENECLLKFLKIKKKKMGSCNKKCKCNFNYNPTCGDDSKNYWNACFAKCGGHQAKKLGMCNKQIINQNIYHIYGSGKGSGGGNCSGCTGAGGSNCFGCAGAGAGGFGAGIGVNNLNFGQNFQATQAFNPVQFQSSNQQVVPQIQPQQFHYQQQIVPQIQPKQFQIQQQIPQVQNYQFQNTNLNHYGTGNKVFSNNLNQNIGGGNQGGLVAANFNTGINTGLTFKNPTVNVPNITPAFTVKNPMANISAGTTLLGSSKNQF